ncbi:MAG: DinB family protein [Hyphomicrobiales bacterium]|nr:DinB family protein [Hyphomicrobiales bacterium]
MDRADQLRLMADYNAWMNARLYDAAATLPAEAVAADRGAFFGSLLGTLEHLVVGDTIWLKRFAEHRSGGPLTPVRELPQPQSLGEIQFGALGPLRERRELLDRLIGRWTTSLDETDLDAPLTYRSTRGETFTKPFGLLCVHLFNHQTHHRGQATTLLSQAGVDVGTTDFLAFIPSI